MESSDIMRCSIPVAGSGSARASRVDHMQIGRRHRVLPHSNHSGFLPGTHQTVGSQAMMQAVQGMNTALSRYCHTVGFGLGLIC